jgi:hypothetical protein
MNWTLLPLFVSLFVAMSPALGESAQVKGGVSCSGVDVGLSMDIDGDIDAATVENVKRLFEQFHQREADVKSRSITCGSGNMAALGTHYGINSRGGDVDAAMAIGRMLRKENAWIEVNGLCISACVLILAGAVDRLIGADAKVGIHRPYLAIHSQSSVTADQVKNSYRTILHGMRVYLREMNVSDRLADDMLAVAPEHVRILTEVELREYSLLGVDSVEQERRAVESEVQEVREAHRLGLERLEYNRRKALGETLCPLTDPTFWICRENVLRTGRRS